jgi:hypothetical protein
MAKKNIGDVINKLSKAPVLYVYKITEGETEHTFDLYIHKPDFLIMNEYTSFVKARPEGKDEDAHNRDAIKLMVCACVRDKDGDRIWQKPEDIDISATDFLKLQNQVTKYALKIDVTDFEIKNSQDSLSSEPVSK